MIKNKVIVFDLDDTLYAERNFVFSGFDAIDQWLEGQGIVGFKALARSVFDRGVRGTIFNEVLGELDVLYDKAFIQELLRVYRQHKPIISLYEDADLFLKGISNKFHTAIITDGYLEVQKNKVSALGLGERIEFILCSDSLGRENWKPSVLPYQTVMEAFPGIKAENFIYIGDNPEKDFIAARSLGWKTIRMIHEIGENIYKTAKPGFEADETVSCFNSLSIC